MAEEKMKYLIRWDVDQDEFRREIRQMIHQARTQHKVIPLPFSQTGQPALDLLTVILGEVNCDYCDAPCCKVNPNGEPIDLLPAEVPRLSQHGLKGTKITMPCEFLKSGRCSVYPDRPLVCLLYPFQPGANDGEGRPLFAVASSCPEGRRIARDCYMMAWKLRSCFYSLGDEFFKVLSFLVSNKERR
jgi:Fe-S-cluster containining protein